MTSPALQHFIHESAAGTRLTGVPAERPRTFALRHIANEIAAPAPAIWLSYSHPILPLQAGVHRF